MSKAKLTQQQSNRGQRRWRGRAGRTLCKVTRRQTISRMSRKIGTICDAAPDVGHRGARKDAREEACERVVDISLSTSTWRCCYKKRTADHDGLKVLGRRGGDAEAGEDEHWDDDGPLATVELRERSPYHRARDVSCGMADIREERLPAVGG